VSHISIIINRTVPTQIVAGNESSTTMHSDPVSATVTYEVPHDTTDAEVGQAVKKLYKQVRELGS